MSEPEFLESCRDFFKVNPYKLGFSLVIFLYFIFFKSPASLILSNPLRPDGFTWFALISFLIFSAIINAIIAYSLTSLIIFDYNALKIQITNLKKFTNVLSVKQYIYPIIITLIFTTIGMSYFYFNYTYFHHEFLVSIGDGLRYFMFFIIISIIMTIYYWKKDLITERMTIFFLLYTVIGSLLMIIINTFSLIGNIYFFENFLGGLVYALFVILIGTTLGFILGIIIDFFKMPRAIWNKKMILFHVILLILIMILVISKLNHM